MNRFCFSLLLLLSFSAFACGQAVGPEGTSVGGACTVNTDCDPQSRCLGGGDFPGGTCAVNCSTHEDCPNGSRCVSKEGGVCLLQCELPEDCRAGYTCKGRGNESGGGESLICIED